MDEQLWRVRLHLLEELDASYIERIWPTSRIVLILEDWLKNKTYDFERLYSIEIFKMDEDEQVSGE